MKDKQTAQHPADESGSNAKPDALPENSLSLLRSVKVPTQDLPAKMVVAIDGWAHSGKNTAGELVAEAIGGVLVDSGRFYRVLTKACLDAGVNLDDSAAVAEYCWSVPLDIRMRCEGGLVAEAQVAALGRWFTKDQLQPLGAATSKVARVTQVREMVNRSLLLCAGTGRVVMLGRDIGGVVLPDTPFKFFLDAPKEIRERRHVAANGRTGAISRDREDERQVVFAQNALMIDTGRLQPAEVRGIILLELFRRASEQKKDKHG
jgi:cytidylate kinase